MRATSSRWAPRIRDVAKDAKDTHVLMNNCYANYGTTNAREMAAILAGELADCLAMSPETVDCADAVDRSCHRLRARSPRAADVDELRMRDEEVVGIGDSADVEDRLAGSGVRLVVGDLASRV